MKFSKTSKQRLLFFFASWYLVLRFLQFLLSLPPWIRDYYVAFPALSSFRTQSLSTIMVLIVLNIIFFIFLLILALLVINKPKLRKILLFLGLLIGLFLTYEVMASYRYAISTGLKEAGVTFLILRPITIVYWQAVVLLLSFTSVLIKKTETIKEIIFNTAVVSLIFWLVVNIGAIVAYGSYPFRF